MRIAIHQPQYLPWLGYLAKWAAADAFVFLDTVQYEKNGYQNRNRIKTASGAQWLTVPVHARLGMPIREVRVDASQPWAARHLRAIELAYRRAPHWPAYRDALARLCTARWDYLAPLAMASAQMLAGAAGIATPVRLASSLALAAEDPTGRLVAICRALGADTYLAGGHAARYMDRALFEAAGIRVLYQRYEHPVYAQQHGDFVPFMSGLDLLLAHGDECLSILRRGDAWSPEP